MDKLQDELVRVHKFEKAAATARISSSNVTNWPSPTEPYRFRIGCQVTSLSSQSSYYPALCPALQS